MIDDLRASFSGGLVLLILFLFILRAVIRGDPEEDPVEVPWDRMEEDDFH
jgi:hypothetical protein